MMLKLISFILQSFTDDPSKAIKIIEDIKKHGYTKNLYHVAIFVSISIMCYNQINYSRIIEEQALKIEELTVKIVYLERITKKDDLEQTVIKSLSEIFTAGDPSDRKRDIIIGTYRKVYNNEKLQSVLCRVNNSFSACNIKQESSLQFTAFKFGTYDWTQEKDFNYQHPPFIEKKGIYTCRKFNNNELTKLFNKKFGVVCAIEDFFSIFIISNQDITRNDFMRWHNTVENAVKNNMPDFQDIFSK